MNGGEDPHRMFRLARSDGEAVRALCDNPGIADEIIGFHTQQAIEKALKAWLASLGVDYLYTHNIIVLLNLLEERNENVERFRRVARYNAFAVQFRYPGAERTSAELDRQVALADMTSVLEHVEKILGQ